MRSTRLARLLFPSLLIATTAIAQIQNPIQAAKDAYRRAKEQQQQQQGQQQPQDQQDRGSQKSEAWTPPAENSAPALRNPLELPILEKMPDVIGVKPGMSSQQALQLLHAQYPRDMFQEMKSTAYPGADAGWNLVQLPSGVPDVYVSFTAPPTKQVVWRIFRETRNMHVARANVLAALREKYGKETMALGPNGDPRMPATDARGIYHMFWLFDERGNRVPLPADPFNNFGACAGENMMDARDIASGAQPNMPVDDASNRFTGWCRGYVTLHVSINPSRDPDIIEYTLTDLLDAPLALRTARVYKAWKRDADAKAREADLEKAKKNKPVF